MSKYEREQITSAALEAGFMLSTGHGQGAGKLMPVSDVATLTRFAELLAPSLPQEGEVEKLLKACERVMEEADLLSEGGDADSLNFQKDVEMVVNALRARLSAPQKPAALQSQPVDGDKLTYWTHQWTCAWLHGRGACNCVRPTQEEG